MAGEGTERDNRDGEEVGGREERQGEDEGEGEGDEEEGVGEVLETVGRLSRARTISYFEARSRYWSLRLRG